MKFLTTVFIVLFCSSLALADSPEKFKQIRIFVPDKPTLDRIWSTGIDYEGVTGKIGDWMEFVAGEYELQQLAAKGISYQIAIDDLAKFYESRLPKEPVNALGFGYGSMGGYYTYSEVGLQLDSLRLLYPNLITQKQVIGMSLQNRPIWAVKMTANADNAPPRPQVHYNSLTHAREPAGMMALLYFMWYLAENYGTNPEVTYLLNNRELWFIPVVNPDGYVHNQSTNPNGGGMWRKNRRLNADGSYGVDLNRNYGYMWGYDNNGSSPNPPSETYRGTAPFSEPETQVIRDFCNARNFKDALNYHTYSNLLIYPWGYIPALTPDSVIFREYATEMTQFNGYAIGTATQLLYAVNGVSDDWFYGEQITKPKIIAMTPEVGSSADGFWPPTNRILPLARENVFPNLYLAWAAGAFPKLQQRTIIDANGNGHLERGETFQLRALIRNKGLGAAENLQIWAQSLSPSLLVPSTVTNLSVLGSRTDTTLTWSGEVSPFAITGTEARIMVNIALGTEITLRDTIRVYLGIPTVPFTDGAETGTSNWTTGQAWGRHSTAHTGSWSFTDSPAGNYANNANNSLTLISPITLPADAVAARLKFWARWDIEPRWDFGRVEVSTNGGGSWTALPGRFTRPASGSGAQTPAGTPGYDGVQSTWVEEEMSLSPFAGQNILLRFRITTDGSVVRDGMYVDDISVFYYVPNYDTGLVVQPIQFQFSGVTGRIFVDTLKIYNLTANTIQITIAETTGTSASNYISSSNSSSADIQGFLARLKSAFQKANITKDFFIQQTAQASEQPDSPTDPEVFTTIITDERNEFGFGAVDIYRVQHQFRTVPIVGNFHDFRIVLANLPDTNVAGFISIDTDQDFGTGAFPTPFGLGPTSRDAGSEREVFFDASGIIFDTLGFGRIRAGIVINTENDSIVGTPFLLAINRDSVLTITTNGLGLGIRDGWLADPDRKMNVGVVASRVGQNVNPLPDFAPLIGHGTVGAETGVSWITQDVRSLTIASRDSARIRIRALAAKPAGTYTAQLRIIPSSGNPISVPVIMNVTTPPPPRIVVSQTSFIDTVAVGDSVFQNFTITNTGGSQLTYGILDTANTPWLTISPTFGILDSGQVDFITMIMRATGLVPDSTYTAMVFVASNDPLANSVPLTITLRVTHPTAVHESDPIPTRFALLQNYPNPFNPSTTIRFEIPEAGFVLLRVYNILGQQVSVLLSEELDAGRYSVAWDASEAPSGVYLYRLQFRSTTGGQSRVFTETKKMILMR